MDSITVHAAAKQGSKCGQASEAPVSPHLLCPLAAERRVSLEAPLQPLPEHLLGPGPNEGAHAAQPNQLPLGEGAEGLAHELTLIFRLGFQPTFTSMPIVPIKPIMGWLRRL